MIEVNDLRQEVIKLPYLYMLDDTATTDGEGMKNTAAPVMVSKQEYDGTILATKTAVNLRFLHKKKRGWLSPL